MIATIKVDGFITFKFKILLDSFLLRHKFRIRTNISYLDFGLGCPVYEKHVDLQCFLYSEMNILLLMLS